MNRSKLLAALLVLTVAACGTVGVQGDRCEIGRAQSCPCASGAVGVQECSPAGVYGACVCAADAGADVAIAVDAAPADGAPDAPAQIDAAADVAPTCDADLDRDPMNCGSCGRVCPRSADASAVCTMGRCALACRPGTRGIVDDCDGDPANGCETVITSDPRNCGGCGVVCAAGEMCLGVNCTRPTTCAAGTTSCGGNCRDLYSDPMNCGRCSNVCPSSAPTCRFGGCTRCPADRPRSCFMDTLCADLLTDNANCGACGRACAAGTHCVGAVCVPI